MTILKYDPNTSGGTELQNAVLELRSSVTRLQRISDVLGQANAATTPAVIEVNGANADLFGVAAGQGAAFTALVTGLAAAVNSASSGPLASLFR